MWGECEEEHRRDLHPKDRASLGDMEYTLRTRSLFLESNNILGKGKLRTQHLHRDGWIALGLAAPHPSPIAVPPPALTSTWGCAAGLMESDRSSWDTNRRVFTSLGQHPAGRDVLCREWKIPVASPGAACSPSTQLRPTGLGMPCSVYQHRCARAVARSLAGPWGCLGNQLCRKPAHSWESPPACTGGQAHLRVRWHDVTNVKAIGTWRPSGFQHPKFKAVSPEVCCGALLLPCKQAGLVPLTRHTKITSSALVPLVCCSLAVLLRCSISCDPQKHETGSFLDALFNCGIHSTDPSSCAHGCPHLRPILITHWCPEVPSSFSTPFHGSGFTCRAI